MSSHAISIGLVSRDPSIAEHLNRAIGGDPNYRVESLTGTLAGLNGTAQRMADAHDLIIFRTSEDRAEDLPAIAELRERAGPGKAILALTDDSVSLAEARALERAGIDSVMPVPESAAELRRRVEDLTRQLARASQLPVLYAAERRLGRVIAVCPARGGIGASTLAVNLAEQLSQPRGRFRRKRADRVALVDLDLQYGAVASLLDIAPNELLYLLAEDGDIPDAGMLERAVHPVSDSFAVIAAPERIAPVDAVSARQVGAMIDALRVEYDYVVLDLPRAVASWSEAVANRADRMLFVTDMTPPSVVRCRRLIDLFVSERVDLPYEVIVSQETKPLLGARAHAAASEALERPLKHWMPPDPKAARAAADRGVPLSRLGRKSHLGKAVAGLAASLAAEFAQHATQRPEPK